jgi:hypothetical protein
MDENKLALLESSILLNEGLWSKFKEWRKERRRKRDIRINGQQIKSMVEVVEDGKAFFEMYSEMIKIEAEIKRMRNEIRKIDINHMLVFCELVEDWELFLVYNYFITEYKKHFEVSHSFQRGEKEYREYVKQAKPIFLSGVKMLEGIGKKDSSLRLMDETEYQRREQRTRVTYDEDGNATTELIDVIVDYSNKSEYSLVIFDKKRLMILLDRRVREQKDSIDRLFKRYRELNSLD